MKINFGDIVLKKKINFGDIKLGIKKVYPELEDLEITPTSIEQNFKSEKYGYDNVKVKAVASDELNITPSKEEQQFIGLYGTVNVEGANVQSKEISKNGTYNAEDENLLAYDKVDVNIINYQEGIIIPESNPVEIPVDFEPSSVFIILNSSETHSVNHVYNIELIKHCYLGGRYRSANATNITNGNRHYGVFDESGLSLVSSGVYYGGTYENGILTFRIVMNGRGPAYGREYKYVIQ